MGANNRTTMHETTPGPDAGTQIVPAGSKGYIVAMQATIAGVGRYYNGTSASDPEIAALSFSVAGGEVSFPAGYMPEFTNGLFRVTTGTSSVHRVWTA